MKKYLTMTVCFSLLIVLFTACNARNDQPREDPVFPPFDFRYNLEEPDQTLEMPGKLEEISGLGITSDSRHLVAVQDEKGVLFFINKENGAVDKEVEFWKDGDYEGVEAIGDHFFAVKSSGTIYHIELKGDGNPRVEKFNEQLGQKNDVEGLGYDPVGHKLLIGCKGAAGVGEEFRFKKAIYSFDLATMKTDSVPTYIISLEDVQAYLGTSPSIRKIEKLVEYFSLDKSEFVFSPSGVAVHPVTGHIYITSSVGKLLMVLDRDGSILHIEKLKKSVHPQPEGICFDRDGALYIANEGKGDKGVIHRFTYLGS